MHCNSTVGLLPYSVNLDDGGTYRSSKGQRWLWRNWLSFWDDVSASVENPERTKVWTVFNGDWIDKPNGRFKGTQFITSNDSDIKKMAIDVVEPALEVSDLCFVTRGTKVHVGQLEEELAEDIGAEMIGDNYSTHELLLEVEGVLYDIRHHGPLGRLEHTMGNALNRRAKEIEDLYWSQNRKCPDVAVQNHNHRFATSSDQYAVKVFAGPAWQLTAEYAHGMKIIKPADIGGMYFINDKGEYNPVVKRYKPEGQRPWRPSRRKT